MSKSSYSLKMTPKAAEDLDNMYNYISKELDAEGAAGKLLNKIETRIMALKEFPFSRNYVASVFLKNKGYRKLIIDNYIAFYLIDEDKKEVVIMRVLYGRQKYEVLL